MFRHIHKHHIWPLLITLGLTVYQIIRIIIFANVYGGIEHDGGWMLSISRSLAEQGTYTTLVSTIVDPGPPGSINIDQKFDIQAADGRIWFFTGNGIGPASIVPDALVLKLFGTGFWALQAGPLIFYTLFLILAAVIMYRLAGLGAVLLFHAFIFFYPHLSIFLGFEAMGEVPGLVYVLWAYLVGAAALQKTNRRGLWFLGAGLVAGLALIAKLITLWSLSGIFMWAGLLWLVGLIGARTGGGEPIFRLWGVVRPKPVELVALAGGAILPTVLWELVQLVVLTRLAGFALYVRHLQQRIQFILDDGSGVGLKIHFGPEFFWDKFFTLGDVAHPQRWVTALVFGLIVLGGLVLLWQWRSEFQKRDLLASLWLGWLANTAWFVGLAKTGWARHYWFGLVLAAMLLSVIGAAWVRRGLSGWDLRLQAAQQAEDQSDKPAGSREIMLPPARTVRWPPLVAGILALGLIFWGFAEQPHVVGFALPDEIVPYWREKQVNDKYGASLPWIIIPRAAQNEVIDYIEHMPPQGHVFYPGGHKSAEIPPMTGRMHYPLDRRNYIEPDPADIVLIGPSIVSPWKDPIQRQALLELVQRECPWPALQNDFYIICPIEDNLSQRR